MKIAVNTRLLRKDHMDGIGWFTFNILKHIVRDHPQTEFHFFFDSGIHDMFLFAGNVIPHQVNPPAKHALLNLVWFEWSVKRLLKKIEPDLFFSPDGILCLGWAGRQHGVIHDINFFHHPSELKWSNRLYYNLFFPKYARRASQLATVSAFSKQDIIRHYNIPPEKIDVVYNAVNESFAPIDEQRKIDVRSKLTGGAGYFLFVGSLLPRKNLVSLLRAYELFRATHPSDIKLVIAGKPSYRAEDLYRAHYAMRFKQDVIFPGRIADTHLNDVLASATALVFIPHFEGFGMPLIEAMQCGVPVIASNVTAIPEVAGDAAILVAPFDIAAIAESMQMLISDNMLRQNLIAKGFERSKTFSWKRSAEALWDSLEKCL